MHGTMNLKFANAKQAKDTHEYRNIKIEAPDDGHKSARNI
jgi:hypothetical protein